jgi:hypothetical protein
MTPTAGLSIGLPIIAAITVVMVGAIVACILHNRSKGYNDTAHFEWVIGILLIIMLGFSAWGYWPYKQEYHYYKPVSGTVEDISSRITPTDKSVEQKFVVKLQDDPTLYGITDTRASLLKKGDTVSISCKREYEWGSTNHGWNCKWGGS